MQSASWKFSDLNPRLSGDLFLYFQKATESLHIYSKINSYLQGITHAALSHEFTHFVEELSAEKFRKFTDVLFDVLGKSDVDVNRLIEAKEAVLRNTEEYKDRSEKELRAIAYSEAVAEMMEPVLTDTDAISRISQKIKQQDRSLWGKIKDFIKGIVEKLKAAYRDMEPDSAIARLTRETVTNSEAVLEAFSDAAADAVLNYNLQEGQKNSAREGVRYSKRKSLLTEAEIEKIQSIGQKSLNKFSHEDIQATEKFAKIYWNEMGVKSPFFRAWFGDWRINDSSPITVANKPGDVRGTVHNADTGWDINVSGKIFSETKAHGSTAARGAVPYLPFINDIVENAVLLDSFGLKNGKSPNSLLMHSLYAVADIGNGQEVVKLLVEEMNDPNSETTKKRSYQLQNIEKAFAASVRVQGKATSSAPSSVTNTANAIRTVADLFSNVKQKDRDFMPNKASKVVNADGTPKVMYHGTNAEFTVFDRSKGKKKIHLNVFGDGNYFTALEQGAARYGENVVPAYLNIKNPYVKADGFNTVADQIASEFGIARDSFTGKDVSSILRQRGYDGVVMYDGNGEIVIANAFDSNQIKSATDNVGTFDGSNPDIRYSSRDSAGNSLTEAQQRYFADSQVRDEDGNLIPVYHRTDGDFTVFQRGKLGGATLSNAADAGLAATSLVGHWFSDHDLGDLIGKNVVKSYLNIQNPYETDLLSLAQEISGFSSNPEMMQAHFENGQYNMVRKAAAEFTAWLRSEGYDGLKVNDQENGGVSYVVLDSRQAKLTTNQNPTGARDIRYSSRTASDSEYLNLAQNPEENREALSRMVENAAREAVYTRLFFHGSKKGGGFTVFRDWQYFTENREYAKRYANRENPGSLYETYVKMENPFDTRIPEVRELFEQARLEYGMGELQENGLPDWTDGYDIADYIDENDLPYDGIILDEGGDMVNGKPVSRGLSYVIRDSSQVKSADAVTYDDNGNVIPLSQRFDTGKEDIRYSARNPQAQVEAENERLKTELEYLKKLVQIQKRGNNDFTLDRNSLRKAARALMNANNVKGNVAELAEILDRVYRYAGTEPEITWEGFAEKAGEAADWLTENRAKERDPYAQQILDAVAKRRVSLNAEQIGEIEYQYGSLSEFKKAIKGSIILDQNANTSLDQLWQELSGEYPGTFEAGTTDADMPGAFADIVDELRNSESANEAERQYYADEERNQFIRQVYDGYWDVDPVQSVSDKAKKEIDQLKAEHREAIRELKAENRQLKSDAQSQVAAAVREYRQQNNAMTREMKKTYERQLKEVQKEYEKFRSQAESLSSESTMRYQNEFYNALMGTENLGKAKIPELRKKFRELAVENSGKDMDARKARQTEYTRLLDEFLTSRDIGKLRTTIQEQRDRAKAKVEAARVTEQRGKLYRAVNEINRRLLNPTKTLYVPDSLAPAVTKFMQGLTEAMESPKNSWNVQGALETLQEQYRKLTQMNEGVFTQEYNQGILDLLDNAISAVGGTDFNKLSASQIEDVYSAVRSVLTAIRNENKMFAANLNKTYAEAAEAVRREEAALPNRKPTTGAVQDKAEKFGWNQLKPVYAMMRLGSDTLLKQYNNLRAGEDKWQRTIAAARAYGLGIMAKYHYDQWNDSLMKLDTETGTVELSLEERMSLYAYARREQAFEHLTKGGFVLSDKNTRTVKNRFGIETEQI